MTQQYDKIFKENFEELIHSLIRAVLKIDDLALEEIPDDSQYTIEKRPDFLKKVKATTPKDDYILQIEVQTTAPKSMRKRMLIYYSFLFHDYEIPVQQYVLYIGKKSEINMPTVIKHRHLNFDFQLINIADLDHEQFLYSETPADIVIAILCDFKGKSDEQIIDTILQRLKLFSNDALELGRYVTQLEVLSNLRNLQELTIKKLNNMPFFYDLETDIRYQQGRKIEREASKAKIQEAELKAKRAEQEAEQKVQSIVRELLGLGLLQVENIANIAKVSIDYVKVIQQQMNDEADGRMK